MQQRRSHVKYTCFLAESRKNTRPGATSNVVNVTADCTSSASAAWCLGRINGVATGGVMAVVDAVVGADDVIVLLVEVASVAAGVAFADIGVATGVVVVALVAAVGVVATVGIVDVDVVDGVDGVDGADVVNDRCTRRACFTDVRSTRLSLLDRRRLLACRRCEHVVVVIALVQVRRVGQAVVEHVVVVVVVAVAKYWRLDFAGGDRCDAVGEVTTK